MGHHLCMLRSGTNEVGIAVQQGQAVCGALLVSGGEKILFCDGGSISGVDGSLCESAGKYCHGECHDQNTMRWYAEQLHAGKDPPT